MNIEQDIIYLYKEDVKVKITNWSRVALFIAAGLFVFVLSLTLVHYSIGYQLYNLIYMPMDANAIYMSIYLVCAFIHIYLAKLIIYNLSDAVYMIMIYKGVLCAMGEKERMTFDEMVELIDNVKKGVINDCAV